MATPPNVIVLLGAGASVEAGIPTMINFTESFEKNVLYNHRDATDLLQFYYIIKELWVNLPRYRRFDLEALYQTLEYINKDDASITGHLLASTLPTKDRRSELIQWHISKYIQESCLIRPGSHLDYLSPLLNLSTFSNPLNILTFNYDTTIEALCDSKGIPWQDGFDELLDLKRPRFPPYPKDSENTLVNLTKLHGSVLWIADSQRRIRRRPYAGPPQTPARPLVPERMMLYPGMTKIATTEPFVTNVTRLRELLHWSQICVSIGYSFVDEYIQNILKDAMERNPYLRTIIVDPRGQDVVHHLFQTQGIDQSRLLPVPKMCGYTSKALAAGWLQDYVAHVATRDPIGAPGNSSIPLPPRYSTSKHRKVLTGIDTSGLYLDTSLNKLYATSSNTGCLFEIDLDNQTQKIIATGVEGIRGVCLSENINNMYFVENYYRPHFNEHVPTAFLKKEGISRAWTMDLSSGAQYPLHGKGSAPLALDWANEIALSCDEAFAYITEARGLSRINISTLQLERDVPFVPLAFNVSSISRVSHTTMLILDHGVVDAFGSGRLMLWNTISNDLDIIHTFGPFGWSARYCSATNRILYSRRLSETRGEIIELDFHTCSIVDRYLITGQPFGIAVSEDGRQLYVATNDGVVIAKRF